MREMPLAVGDWFVFDDFAVRLSSVICLVRCSGETSWPWRLRMTGHETQVTDKVGTALMRAIQETR